MNILYPVKLRYVLIVMMLLLWAKSYAQRPGKLIIIQEPAIDSVLAGRTVSSAVTPAADIPAKRTEVLMPPMREKEDMKPGEPPLPTAPAAATAAAAKHTAVKKRVGGMLTMMGYRVQIYYGTNRRELNNIKARFDKGYPQYNSYISFTSPNYYLTVGDFKSRAEAQSLMNSLRRQYPVLFVKREKIRIYY